MKTARKLTIAIGLLVLLYMGAYWLFARDEMRDGYPYRGTFESSGLGRSDWHKLFFPVAFLDYRMNVERPFRKSFAGHWKSADSQDFVTLARDGQCSFRIGEFQGTGKAQLGSDGYYAMGFARGGQSCIFEIWLTDENGNAEGSVSSRGRNGEAVFPTLITLTKSPD